MTRQVNAAAYNTWQGITKLQIDRHAWTRLCSKLRVEEAEKNALKPEGDHDVSINDEDKVSTEAGHVGTEQHHVSDEQLDDSMFEMDTEDAEMCETTIDDRKEHEQWNNTASNSRLSFEPGGQASTASHTESNLVRQNVTREAVTNEVGSIKRKIQQLNQTLEDLNVQLITIGDWIIIQRSTFDIHIKEEPYHSIQIYANLNSMKFIRRVWGISERSGELRTMDDMRDLCIATFNKSAVCLGHIDPNQGGDLNFLKLYTHLPDGYQNHVA